MVEEKHPAVYILANRYRGTLYTGVTSRLWTRVAEHKGGAIRGFTSQYEVHMLVWYEHRHTMLSAIAREKRIKAWKREWKINLIEKFNPDWRDLHEEIDEAGTLIDEEAGPQPALG